MWILLLRAALAAPSVVVLDVEPDGVRFEATRVATASLREGLRQEGSFDVLSPAKVEASLTAGHEAGLQLARQQIAEAREHLGADQPDLAIDVLAAALDHHRAAGSAACRAPELADVHGWLAAAALREDRPRLAQRHAAAALVLYPRWHEERAYGLNEPELRFFEDSAGAEPALLPVDLAQVGWRAGADYVVTARLARDGTMEVRLHDQGRTAGTALERLAVMPPDADDPTWLVLASMLGKSVSGPVLAPPLYTREISPAERDIPIYDLDDPAPSDAPPPRAGWGWWVAGAALIGGVATGVAVLVQPDPIPPATQREPDSYSVRVETGD